MARGEKVDYFSLPIEGLERLLNVRQRKFVAGLVKGLCQTEAAVSAGYSRKTAASQGSELLKNPKVAAYRRALARSVFDGLGLSPEAIGLMLFEVYERCMSKKPVLVWDVGAKAWVEGGSWQFDSKGATRVLELLGRHAGMFERGERQQGAAGALEDYLMGLDPA